MRQHIVEMLGGPGTMRFALQPIAAAIVGWLLGMRDQRLGHPPVLMSIIHARGRRLHRLGEALRAIAIPLAVALLASVAFQYIIRSRVRLAYAVLYALLFVAAPYFVARGLANRLRGLRHRKLRPR